MTRALKLQKRAARVGFDWPSTAEVFDKIDEEILEIKEEIENTGSDDALEDEVGDLLFVVVNLARHLKVDPDAALRRSNAKFDRRFRHLEARLAAAGKSLEESDLEEMERLWQEAKSL
jgi:MazG family protein